MNQGTAAADLRNGVAVAGEAQEFVTVTVAGQLFGIPVLQVQDVLGPQRITPIPLAPPEVAGSPHLRGRIVTPTDPRTPLQLPQLPDREARLRGLVDHHRELYRTRVDAPRAWLRV